MKSLLTTVIPVHSIKEAECCLEKLDPRVDVVELRIDFLKDSKIAQIASLLKQIQIPAILTVRSQRQGGQFLGTEQERLALIEQCMQLLPAYLDIELDLDPLFITKLQSLSPDTQLILSSHNFEKTPENLDALLAQMKHPDISIYKIITTANSSLDALRMMAWVRSKSNHHKLVGHCMGKQGMISRIAGPVIGNALIYASEDSHNAVVSHQVSVETTL